MQMRLFRSCQLDQLGDPTQERYDVYFASPLRLGNSSNRKGWWEKRKWVEAKQAGGSPPNLILTTNYPLFKFVSSKLSL